MPTGVIINSLAIIIGGVLGAVAGHRMSAEFKDQMNLVFAICSMGMGIYAIAPMRNMPAVIFAVIIGTALGLACHLGRQIESGARLMKRGVQRLTHTDMDAPDAAAQSARLITIIVLFCASGTGIYGSLTNGMTGDATILISKSMLDLFTAAVFATQLGYVVAAIAIPQFIIFFVLFLMANWIFPLTTPAMVLDFKAAGGFLMLATGFRMANIKPFPTADMIPAMILVMPFSWAWTNWIMPLL